MHILIIIKNDQIILFYLNIRTLSSPIIHFCLFVFLVIILLFAQGMEIQTKPIFKTKTPRVKCVTGHPNYPDVLVCLFTGEIRLYDTKTFSIKKSAQICDVPIRTGVIVPSKDWILIGNDDGFMIIVDLGNLSIIDTIKAHDDFIRKIVVDEHNQRIITVSDDNRTKLWSFSDGIVQINRYKDSKHFVMDACIYPADSNYFFTVSLDAKIRMYSVANNKLLKVYKGHEKGINSISFISSENFITGSDDSTVMIWDVKRLIPIAVLKGHTKNVNCVKNLKNGFATCSEDNTVRFWSKEYRTLDIIDMQGRVWDIYVKDNKIFIGSDEELCVFQEISSSITAVMRDNKILYNQGNTLLSVKTDDLGAYKELGSIEDGFDRFEINQSGKLIAIQLNNDLNVYSILGMRKKYSDVGKDLYFIDQDRFVYLKGHKLILVAKNEIELQIEIPEISKILHLDTEYIVFATQNSTLIHTLDESFAPIHEFTIIADKCAVVNNSYVLFSDQIHVYNHHFDEIGVFDHRVECNIVSEDVLYFNTVNKTFYMLFENDKAHIYPMKYYPNLIGVKNSKIFYYSGGIKQDTFDTEYINFKKDFFMNLDPTPSENFKDKAISFFESLNMHEKALSLCSDENQKFDILIKLNRLDEASENTNSPIKHEKLGKKYLCMGYFDKASESFMKSNDLSSLLITDCFGSKRHLDHVSKKAIECGKYNLAFIAAYKNNDFKLCSNLLHDTPFFDVFNKYHLQ